MIRFRDETAKKLGIEMLVYTNEEGVKQDQSFDHGAAYTDIMKTQALKQALTSTALPQHSAAADVTRKVPCKGTYLLVPQRGTGVGSEEPAPGKPWKLYNTKIKKGESIGYSRSPTGQKRTSGSISNGKTSTLCRCISQPKDRWFTGTAISSWWMTIVCR